VSNEDSYTKYLIVIIIMCFGLAAPRGLDLKQSFSIDDFNAEIIRLKSSRDQTEINTFKRAIQADINRILSVFKSAWRKAKANKTTEKIVLKNLNAIIDLATEDDESIQHATYFISPLVLTVYLETLYTLIKNMKRIKRRRKKASKPLNKFKKK
jgi:hypothetical protein